MIKTFIIGIVLGIGGVIAALMFVPVVDQAREVSIISVSPNGGNAESFHVNVPTDRIMIGDADREAPLPEGMVWPDHELPGDVKAELYKLRNSRDAVVGVASRIAVANETVGEIIEWVLHLPARGSLYISLKPEPTDGRRTGSIIAGTREFEDLDGQVEEQWLANTAASTTGPAGRIQLTSSFISTRMPQDDDIIEEITDEVQP